MNQFDLTDLEELGRKLQTILRRQGLNADHIHAVGLIGRGASSSVFSVLVNGEYHVLKVYFSHASFLREQRNRRRLIWPPRIILASPGNHNGLGYDLVLTQVPEGRSFSSDCLQGWVQERLGQHLIELHRIKRRRRVNVADLQRQLDYTKEGVYRAGSLYGPVGQELMAALFAEVSAWLKANGSLMRVPASLLHNDLWWDNIIVAQDEVYLIDWESMNVGDYARDLAFGRIMTDYTPAQLDRPGFWQTPRDAGAINRFWQGIVDAYTEEFHDDTLAERLRFYLVLQTFRRLGDMAFSPLPVDHQLLSIWIEELPLFWSKGLDTSV